MTQKVMIKELGKSYEIGKSNYDMELALRYSAKVGEMQKEAMKADPNDYLSSIKSTLEVLEARKDYLQEALHLSDKELDSYNHKLTPNEFNYACERVLLLVQGNTPKEADESVQHLKEALKKNSTPLTPEEKKKALTHLNNRLIELKTHIEKNLWLKQIFVTRFHVSIQDYDSADYEETREMLAAEPMTSLDDVSGGGINHL